MRPVSNEPIWMQQQDIEPPISISWHKHLHAVAPQFKVHPLIFDVPDAVHVRASVLPFWRRTGRTAMPEVGRLILPI